MDDIVSRLREAADPTSPYVDMPWWWDVPDRGGPAQLLREAAEAIERLHWFFLDSGKCGAPHPNTGRMCLRPRFHPGQHDNMFQPPWGDPWATAEQNQRDVTG